MTPLGMKGTVVFSFYIVIKGENKIHDGQLNEIDLASSFSGNKKLRCKEMSQQSSAAVIY